MLENETNTEEQNLEKLTTLVIPLKIEAVLPRRCDSVTNSFLSVSTVQSSFLSLGNSSELNDDSLLLEAYSLGNGRYL